MTFGEDKRTHCLAMKSRNWVLGSVVVDERYEYKNLGISKNYIGSFSSDIEYNIERTRKTASMIFSSNFDHRKTNSLIDTKF